MIIRKHIKSLFFLSLQYEPCLVTIAVHVGYARDQRWISGPRDTVWRNFIHDGHPCRHVNTWLTHTWDKNYVTITLLWH